MIRRPSSSIRHSPGFTLMEMLLALAVFAILMAAIGGVYFGAFKLRNRVTTHLEASLPLQHTVAVIKRDLNGVLLPGGTFGGPFQSTPTNTMTTESAALGLRASPDIFTSTGQIDERSPYSAVQKVAYYLAAPTNSSRGSDLMRGVTRDLLPINPVEPEAQFLMGGVEDLVLDFYDGAPWQPTWDSTTATNLPLAIRVQINLAPEEDGPQDLAPVEFIVPVMVQARTNSVAAATGGGA